MNKNRTAVLERQRPQAVPDDPEDHSSHAVPPPPQDAAPPRAEARPTGPRRHSDPDEKLMLWGMLFFFGLGLYAAAFVALGVWLTP